MHLMRTMHVLPFTMSMMYVVHILRIMNIILHLVHIMIIMLRTLHRDYFNVYYHNMHLTVESYKFAYYHAYHY